MAEEQTDNTKEQATEEAAADEKLQKEEASQKDEASQKESKSLKKKKINKLTLEEINHKIEEISKENTHSKYYQHLLQRRSELQT